MSEGGGINARVPGYHMGGKTGTAQKIDPVKGGYLEMNILRLSAGSVRRKIRELYALSF